jgi:hypothetical protein
VRCFGFVEVKTEDVDSIMSKVVWWNLAKFMAHTVSQSTLVWGGVVALTLFTVVGGIPLALGAPLMEMVPAARMIVKCACDLILILERAHTLAGKLATKDHIKQATMEYTIQKDYMGNKIIPKGLRYIARFKNSSHWCRGRFTSHYKWRS